RALAGEPVPERAGDPRVHLRQPLPLHRLPGHRGRRGPRRLEPGERPGGALKESTMATTERRWIGKDIPRLEDPKLLAGPATPTPTISRLPARSTPPSSGARIPTRASRASTRAGPARCPACLPWPPARTRKR